MYVRCTHCGYDNSPEYRFCGMCGASLAPPPPPKPLVPPGPRPRNGENDQTENVHGPSFLGLAEDPKVEFHYLYEDEQPSSHVGLVIFLLILFGTAGYLAWQWRHNGFPFNRLNAATAPARPASPPDSSPTPSEDQDTRIDKSKAAGGGDVLPSAPEQKKEPDSSPKAGEQAAPNQTASSPANPGAAPASPATENQEESSTETKPTEEAKATPPSIPEKSSRTKAPPRPHSSKPAPAPAAAAPASPDADLELAGERYLYGNGLPRNCARAESSLRTAALHGNSKAQTVLGTMYATGHCVGRDLPTAYRWFARALHQEPQNSRISADLQVLWRQMTPQEKQLATSQQ